MRIIIDVMSKQGVLPNLISSVNRIATELECSVILVGDEQRIQTQISSETLEIIDAKDNNTSLNHGIELLKQDKPQALLTTQTIKHVAKSVSDSQLPYLPQIESLTTGTIFINDNHPTIILDSGITIEPTSNALVQFAQMGDIYFRNHFGIRSPRIGILSNGEEEGKGTQIIKEAGSLIQNTKLNYVGNVEPHEVISGDVEIVVTDTYTADMFLRTFVPAMKYLSNIVRHQMPSSVFIQIGKKMADPALDHMDKVIESFASFETVILGTQYPITLIHAESAEIIVNSAILALQKSLSLNIPEKIQQILVIESISQT